MVHITATVTCLNPECLKSEVMGSYTTKVMDVKFRKICPDCGSTMTEGGPNEKKTA